MAIIRNTNITNLTDLIFYLDAVNPKSYPGGGSTWYDLSANKNNFTLFNTPTYTSNGTTGTYLSFNGSNQYARSTNAINFDAYSAVTIEIGYRTTNTSATQILYETTGTGASTATGGITLLMNTNNTGTVANTYLSQWQGYGPRLFGFISGTSTFFNAVTEIFVKGVDSIGRVTYVNNSSTVYFTSTGVTTSTSTTTSGLSFSNTWTYLASRAGSSNFFNGDIAWVRAWGTKINDSNLNQNFNSIKTRQPNSYNDFTILRSDPGGVAVVTTVAISSIFNGLCAYLQGYLTEFQNPSFYSYTLDGDATFITDGGNDMYDAGNFTYPWLISGSNYSTNPNPSSADVVNIISYSNDSSSITLDTDFVYRTLGYGTSPDRRPLTVLGYRSGASKPIGFQKSGNSGADGGGLLSSATLYSGSTVNGFTVYAFYRETYSAGDPSHCDLYMLIGHTNFNSVFGGVASYADPVINGGNGGYLYAASSSNVIAVTILLSKLGGVEVTAAECQTVVQNFTSRMKTYLGF